MMKNILRSILAITLIISVMFTCGCEPDSDDDDKNAWKDLNMDEIKALQEKIDNKEDLTHDDMMLYEDAKNLGYDFTASFDSQFDKENNQENEDNENENEQENQGNNVEIPLTDQEREEWEAQIGIMAKPKSGNVTGTQDVVMSDGRSVQRVVLTGASEDDVMEYFENFDKDGMWNRELEYFNHQFEKDLVNAADGTMENAYEDYNRDKDEALYQLYFKNSDGDICELAAEKDAKNNCFNITITVISNPEN